MNTKHTIFRRLLEPRILEAMADTPVVLIAGPRQSGKTTLATHMDREKTTYINLDNELTLLAAREDPVGFIRTINCAIIDEIQRAPQLLLAIKMAVDQDRQPGRFLLTGSANLMTLPTVADSLAGRMETLTLLPLSQSEIHGETTNWVDAVFEGHFPQLRTVLVGSDLITAVTKGGYPEPLTRPTHHRRMAWVSQYIDALIQRDIKDIAEISHLSLLPSFLEMLGHVSGNLCNYSKLGSQIGLDSKTTQRYVDIFEQMYLVKRLEVWSKNRLSRIVKMPKIYFLDSGLLAALIDFFPKTFFDDRHRFGNLLETFVYGELRKHIAVAQGTYRLYYYRDHDQNEVDFIIEERGGTIIAVEVKAAATIQKSDLRGIERLKSLAGPACRKGIILYDGVETLPLGNDIWAVPFSTLWGV